MRNVKNDLYLEWIYGIRFLLHKKKPTRKCLHIDTHVKSVEMDMCL